MDEIIVNGYAYPSIDSQTLDNWLNGMTLISNFSYGMTSEGHLIPLDDANLISAADDKEVGALMVLTPMDERGQFSDYLVSQVLEKPMARQTLLDEILKELNSKNLFGVDFDFEFVPKQNREQYSELIEEAAELLNPAGYLVTVALAPKSSDDQAGLLYQGHDYEEMGENANFVLLMTYEWGYTYSEPMAVAPINKVRQVIEYGVSEIPPEKILMGIPNYGYDWKLPYVKGETKAEKISNEEAIRRAAEYNATIEFDEVAQTPHFTYFKTVKNLREDGTEEITYEQHEVWFEDERSYNAKMELVKEFGLAGISIWNLMSYTPVLLESITENFVIAKVF